VGWGFCGLSEESLCKDFEQYPARSIGGGISHIFEPPATSSEVKKLSILDLDAFGLCVVRAAVM